MISRIYLIKYCLLAGMTSLVLLGFKYIFEFLSGSPKVDWNIAIGITAIALPLIVQFCSTLWSRQQENYEKIEKVEDLISSISTLEAETKRIEQIQLRILAIEDRVEIIEQLNRSQERAIIRLDAVLETIIKHEQINARMDRINLLLSHVLKNKSKA